MGIFPLCFSVGIYNHIYFCALECLLSLSLSLAPVICEGESPLSETVSARVNFVEVIFDTSIVLLYIMI